MRDGDIGLTHVTGAAGWLLRKLREMGLLAPELGHAFMLRWDGEQWWQLEMAFPRGRAIPWDDEQPAEYYRVKGVTAEDGEVVAELFSEVFVGLPYGVWTALRFLLRAIVDSILYLAIIRPRDAICTQAIVLAYDLWLDVDLVPECDDPLKRWITADDIRDSALTYEVGGN